MVARRKQSATSTLHRFGGDWTAEKLEILRRYLVAYSTALKNQPFKTAYIDAFAGTGYRTLKDSDATVGLLFPDLVDETSQGLLDGSAKMALGVEPRFDRYIFIEKDSGRCAALGKLKEEFPALAADTQIIQGDANTVIQDLCDRNWKNHRAVLFLDPYGMQVEWETIEAIAKTGAIDLWLLFPLGIGVNRLLPRSGKVPDAWRRRLTLLLGTDQWEQELYEERVSTNLFGDSEETKVKAGLERISRYFAERLATVFPAAAPQPRVLYNSANCPMYLFCFAVSSPKIQAREIALRIANHILRSV
ncbi:MAG TPA: three-Cys-motif partner protein TcmP [Thermoanaerobaculia bacterium]|nr:three-Cys-motif partner protein TcmP [Thermoanaerobaculia bacterium]